MVVKGLAAVAALLFWLCPLRTGTQILWVDASIAVLLLCHVLLTELDRDLRCEGTDWLLAEATRVEYTC